MQVQSLTPEEVVALLRRAEKKSLGEYALLLCIFDLALRATEAASIRRENVDFRRGMVGVHVLKRSKTSRKKQKDGTEVVVQAKPAPLVFSQAGGELMEVLKKHIARSPESPWLFPRRGSPDQHIDRKRVQYVYAKHAKALDLGKGRIYHPHVLRHSNATFKARRLAEDGVTSLEAVNVLKDTLRHATAGMALNYIHAASEAMKVAENINRTLTGDLLRSSEKTSGKGRRQGGTSER